MLVVEQRIALQSGREVLARFEKVRGQHLANPAVEMLDHPVRLRCTRFGQAVFDLQRCTQPVEFMLAAGLLLAVE